MSLSGGYRWGKRISKRGKKRTMLSKTRALKSRKKRGTKKRRRKGRKKVNVGDEEEEVVKKDNYNLGKYN